MFDNFLHCNVHCCRSDTKKATCLFCRDWAVTGWKCNFYRRKSCLQGVPGNIFQKTSFHLNYLCLNFSLKSSYLQIRDNPKNWIKIIRTAFSTKSISRKTVLKTPCQICRKNPKSIFAEVENVSAYFLTQKLSWITNISIKARHQKNQRSDLDKPPPPPPSIISPVSFCDAMFYNRSIRRQMPAAPLPASTSSHNRHPRWSCLCVDQSAVAFTIQIKTSGNSWILRWLIH